MLKRKLTLLVLACVMSLAFAAVVQAMWPTFCPFGMSTLWTASCAFADYGCIWYYAWVCQDDGFLTGIDTVAVSTNVIGPTASGAEVRCCYSLAPLLY